MTMGQHRLPPIEWRKEPGLLLTSAAQRQACWMRDHSYCQKCHRWVGKSFHADHIHPLHNIPPSVPFPAALRYWRIENLQTLCHACHRLKSAGEARANAKVKRIRRRLDGTRRPRKSVPSRPLRKPNKTFKPTPTKQLRDTA